MHEVLSRPDCGVRRAVRRVVLIASILGAVLPLQALAGQEEAAHTLADALKEGTFSLGWRYRYEFVDQDGIDKKGHASTLRTSVQYRSKALFGFSGAFEVEDVTAVGNSRLVDNRGSGGLWNGIDDRPVVADPELTEFNQAYLAYHGAGNSTVRAGRLEQTLDNQRFVGNVGWRQNHQSFDAVSLVSTALSDWRLSYTYIDRQHTITGAASAMNTHLVHLDHQSPWGNVAAYGYFLDYDEASLAALSSSTFGARFTGRKAVSSVQVEVLAEMARQSDLADNPADFGLDYVHAGLGGTLHGWGIHVAYEMLRGNGTQAFQTPLGTNHKFNGFADKFLVTPANGLRDGMARFSWDRDRWSTFVDYHHFQADEVDQVYGDELDVQAVYATRWKQSIALKLALYEADQFATDTTKVMAWTAWGF